MRLNTVAMFALTASLAAAPLGCGGSTGPETETPPNTGPYDLTLRGSDFGADEGLVIKVALVRWHETEIVAGPEQLTVSGGAFDLKLEGVLEDGQRYELHFYSDENGTGVCESPPIDHAWKMDIAAAASNIELSVVHTENFTDVCSTFGGNVGPFDLNINGAGYVPHEGEPFFAALVRSDSQEVVAGPSEAVVSGGGFSFSFADALQPGVAYEVVSYADHNGSGRCDAPPIDHGWRTPVGDVIGDHTLELTHSTDFVDVCERFGYYDITVSGSLFDDDEGEAIYVTVVEAESGALAVPIQQSTVVDQGFSTFWPDALRAGTDYNVHYFIDHNANGTCETPPDDHAWAQVVVNMNGDITVHVAHSSTYTDVCASFL